MNSRFPSSVCDFASPCRLIQAVQLSHNMLIATSSRLTQRMTFSRPSRLCSGFQSSVLNCDRSSNPLSFVPTLIATQKILSKQPRIWTTIGSFPSILSTHSHILAVPCNLSALSLLTRVCAFFNSCSNLSDSMFQLTPQTTRCAHWCTSTRCLSTICCDESCASWCGFCAMRTAMNMEDYAALESLSDSLPRKVFRASLDCERTHWTWEI